MIPESIRSFIRSRLSGGSRTSSGARSVSKRSQRLGSESDVELVNITHAAGAQVSANPGGQKGIDPRGITQQTTMDVKYSMPRDAPDHV